jgi:hypothetical protein
VAAARQADARHLHRGLRTYIDDDGMLVVHGRLTPEQGATVQQALEAAADRLWREARESAAPESVIEETTTCQRRADALALVAEAALAGGLDRGTTGDRYQVVLHVDAGEDRAGHDRVAFAGGALECGNRAVDVSTETSARVACDASVVVMRHDATGTTIDVGRRTRTIPPSIRRALEVRDAGCRFPGCTARRCDAHHVVHWAEGGPTALDNLVLLCRHHHRLLHEGGYTVRLDITQAPTFVSAAGRVVPVAPTAPSWPTSDLSGPGMVLRRDSQAATRGRRAFLPTWDGTRFDVGYVIDVMRGNEPVPLPESAL